MESLNLSFEKFGIDSCFIEKLKERYILKPTIIQSLVIPKLIEGKSVLFRSATGTGKTLAFLLPALSEIFSHKGTEASSQRFARTQREIEILIVAPTLELCSQIYEEINFLLSTLYPLSSTLLLTGSVKIEKQIEQIKKMKPVIVVGNPGRLKVLAQKNILKFNNLRFLILDEADRLTAMDCIEDTKGLLSVIEKEKQRRSIAGDISAQAAACSATVGKKEGVKLGALFKNAEIIESDDHEILRGKIEHWAIFSEKRKKAQTLRSLLSALDGNAFGKGKKSRVKALVFTSRNDEASFVFDNLLHHKVKTAGLFGKVNKKPQSGEERKEALDSFRDGKAQVLVSTDLASRGLDIPGITHVIALDVPSDAGAYIHRCGRTGRAGKRGIMVTIGDGTQMRLLSALEKKLKIRVNPKELYEGRVCAPEI